MNKMMMAVAGLAMAVVLTGCGGSPKGVAEDFVNAILQRESDKAAQCVDTTEMTTKEVKDMKETLDELGKKINDNKLEAETFHEKVFVPPEEGPYTLINGAKYTGEAAMVKVQFKKGTDKKSEGMLLQMVKVDDSWKVKYFGFTKDDVEKKEPVAVKDVKEGNVASSPLRLKDIDTSDK